MIEIRTFGPFEFRLDSLELFRDGVKLELRPQPARALQLLTDRPGEVVRREKFCSAIWPDTHVDFSKSLPFCILQLRRALGDDAANPNWIETIPRVGYRFTANVGLSALQPSRIGLLSRARRGLLTGVATSITVTAVLAASLAHSGGRSAVSSSPRTAAVQVEMTAAREVFEEGRYLSRSSSREGLENAVAKFEESVRLDPSRADAWAALAESKARLLPWDVKRLTEIHSALDKALSIDPSNASVHLRIAQIKMLADHDFVAAEAALERALNLDPNLAEAWHQSAWLAAIRGDSQRAVELVARARQLDPVSVTINGDATWLYLGAGLHDDAAEQARRSLTLRPGCFYSREGLVEALFAEGRDREALEEARPILERLGAGADAVRRIEESDDIEHAYRTTYLTLLEQMEGGATPMMIAIARAAAGDEEGSIASLRTAVEQDDAMLVMQIRDPRFALLHDDPRWNAVLARLSL